MNKSKRLFAKTLAIILSVSLLLTICSCEDDKDALSIMNEFCAVYKTGGVIFSRSIPEGEAGHASEDFFSIMYQSDEGSVSDYAVLLLSGLDYAGECAVFVCYSVYDAILVTDLCNKRISAIRSLGGEVNVSFTEDSFVMRRGCVVAMSALRDNDAARRIFERII